MRCFSVIEGVWHGQEALRYDVVSKIIRGLNERQMLDGFNQGHFREIFQGFQYEKMNEISGDRGVMRK